jgi:hypothetical protein
MKKLQQAIAASELRKVLEERKRQYACDTCGARLVCLSRRSRPHAALDHTKTLASRSAARGTLLIHIYDVL